MRADLRKTLAADRVAGIKDRYIIVPPQDQVADPVGVPTVPVALTRETPDLHVPAVIDAPRPPTSRLKATAIQSPALAPTPIYRAKAAPRQVKVAETARTAPRQPTRYAPPVERVSRNYAPQKATPAYMIGVYR